MTQGHGAEFERQSRTDSIYAAYITRKDSQDRLGEIPYARDKITVRPPTTETDADNFLETIIYEQCVDDLIRDVLGDDNIGA